VNSVGIEFEPGQLLEINQTAFAPPSTPDGPGVDELGFAFEEVPDFGLAPVLTLSGERLTSVDGELTRVIFQERGAFTDLFTVTPFAISDGQLKLRIPPEARIGDMQVIIETTVAVTTLEPGIGPSTELEQRRSRPIELDVELSNPYFTYVVNQMDSTVSIIDALSGTPTEIAQIPVGRGAHDIVMTPDGRYGYVANTFDGTISVIDVLTLQEVDFDPGTEGIQRIELPPGAAPNYIELHPSGDFGYATDLYGNALYYFEVDPSNPGTRFAEVEFIDTAQTVNALTGLAFSPDGDLLYVASTGEFSQSGRDDVTGPGFVFVYDYASGETLGEFTLGRKPIGITAAPQETGKPYIAVAVRGEEGAGIVIIDTVSQRIVNSIATNLRGDEPVNLLAASPAALGLALSGTKTSSGQPLALFDINGAESIAFMRDGSYAFVMFNNTWDPADQSTDPFLGAGSNIGILRDPFGEAKWVGATTQVPRAWGDELVIGPDNARLYASMRGVNEVHVYDINALIYAVEFLEEYAPEAVDRPSKPIEQYVADALGVKDIAAFNAVRVQNGLANDTSGQNETTLPNFDNEQSLLRQPLLTKIATGNLTAGIASGPEAPLDIIAQAAFYNEGDLEDFENDPDNVEITIITTGSFEEAAEVGTFRVAVYGSDDQEFDFGEDVFIHDQVFSGSLLTPGQEEFTLTFDQPLNGEFPYYIVYVDSNDDVQNEAREDNNFTVFRVPVLGFEAEFDGNEADEIFGQYIQGVDFVNTLTATVSRDIRDQVDTVIARLSDGRQLNFERVRPDNSVWEYDFIMESATPDLTATLFLYDADGEQVGAEQLRMFEVIETPTWLTDGAEEDVTVEIIFNESDEEYEIDRKHALVDKSAKIPDGTFIFSGLESSISAGIRFTFDFGLNGIATNQWGFFFVDMKLLGFDMPFPLSLDIPIPNTGGIGGATGLDFGTPGKLGSDIFDGTATDERRKKLGARSDVNQQLLAEATKSQVYLADKFAGHTQTNNIGSFEAKPSLTPILSINRTDLGIEKDLTLKPGTGGIEGKVGLNAKVEPTMTIPLFAVPLGPLPIPVADLRFIGKVSLGGTITGSVAYAPTGGTLGGVTTITTQLAGSIGGSIQGNILAGAAASLNIGVTAGLTLTTAASTDSRFDKDFVFGASVVASVDGSAALGLLNSKLVDFKIMEAKDLSKSDEITWFAAPGGIVGDVIKSLTNGGSRSLASPALFVSKDGVFSAEAASAEPGTSDAPSNLPAGTNLENTHYTDLTDETGRQGGGSTTGTLSRFEDVALVEVYLSRTGISSSSVQLDFDAGTELDLMLFDNKLGIIGSQRSSAGSISFDLDRAPAGRYFVGVTGQVDEDSPVDFTVSVTTPTSPLANLVAGLSVGADVLFAGQLVPVTWTVTNLGNTRSEESRARLVGSPDANIDLNDASLIDPSRLLMPALDPGESYSQEVFVTVPQGFLGTNFLGLEVDRYRDVIESSELDNSTARVVFVALPSDRFENNNRPNVATNLGLLSGNILVEDVNIHDGLDEDYYRIELGTEGTAEDVVTLQREGGIDNLVMAIVDDRGQLIDLFVGQVPTDIDVNETSLSLDGLAAGTYYVYVENISPTPVDYQLELNGKLRSGVDLQVESAQAPQAVRPTLEANTFATIRNAGNTVARDVRVDLVGTVDGSEVVLDTVVIARLAASTEQSVTFSYTLPASTASSTIPLRVVVDPDNTVNELNESNNQSALSIETTILPDANEAVEAEFGAVRLGAVNGSVSVTGNLDSSLDLDTFSFELIAPAASGDQIQAIFSDAAGNIDLYLFDATGEQVATALSSTDNETIDLSGLDAGRYTLWVTDYTGSTTAPDYTLNIDTTPVTGANLSLRQMSTSALDALPGETIDVTFEIQNNGTEASGDFEAQFYLSDDTTLDLLSDPQIGAPFTVTSLAAGELREITRSITIPNGTPAGFSLLLLTLDAGDAVTETSESDNTGGIYLGIQPDADANEPNDAPDDATGVVFVDNKFTAADQTLTIGDEDWFGFTLESTARPGDFATLNYDELEGALTLEVLTSFGQVIRTADIDAEDSLFVSLSGLAAGDYFIRVAAAQEGGYSSNYTLFIDPLEDPAAGSGAAEPQAIDESIYATPVADESNQSTDSSSNSNTNEESSPTQPQVFEIGKVSLTEDEQGPALRLFDESASTELLNGGFDLSAPSDAAFGWETRGDVAVFGSAVTLTEGDPLRTRLEQTFLLPNDPTQLRITIDQITLDDNGLLPDDAFEIALLGQGLVPLAGVVSGLSGSDALFNLQPDGRAFVSSTGIVPGSTGSGTVIDTSGQLVLTFDLTGLGLSGGDQAGLVFDLIGLGADNSSIVISEVALLSDAVVVPPIAIDNTINVAEDGNTLRNILVNDLAGDFPIDAASVEIITDVTNGELIEDTSGNGTYLYVPDSNFNGTDTFTYRVSDTQGNASNIATVTFNVTPVNDAPTASDTSVTTLEDTPVEINLTALMQDVEASAGGYTFEVGGAVNGTVELLSDGITARFTPGADFSGEASFTFTGTDSGDGDSAPITSNTAAVSVTVTPVNDAPVVTDDALVETDEDTAVEVDLRTLVDDVETVGDDLVFAVSNPANGSVELLADGYTARFLPAMDFSGPASFAFTVTDTGDGSDGPITTAPATVTVAVNPVNDTPVFAADASAQTDEDEPIEIDLRGFITDVETSPAGFTFEVISATNGTAELQPDGFTVLFTPAADYNGPAAITVRATDTGSGDDEPITVEGTIAVSISPVNDAPTVANAIGNQAPLQDELFELDLSEVFQDVDGDGLTLSVTREGGQPLPGWLSYDPQTGVLSGTPRGGDLFDFTVEVAADDGAADPVQTTFDINVIASNAAPEADDDDAETVQGSAIEIDVLSNDSDADGSIDPASVVIVSGPTGGTVDIDPLTGKITYTPDADFTGTDTFRYTVTDDDGATSNEAQVTITVQADQEPDPIELVGFAVNPGEAQRSNITTVELTFSDATNLDDLIASGDIVNAVTLLGPDGQPVSLASARFVYDQDARKLTIDLTADAFGPDQQTILADGQFQVKLDTRLIHATGAPDAELLDDDGVDDAFVQRGFHKLTGDFDGDRDVDFADRMFLLRSYFSSSGDARYNRAADLNGDGRVDLADYMFWLRQLNKRV